MNFSVDKFKLLSNRTGPVLAIFHKALGIARQLVGFFSLTEEERLMAGIYRDGDRRDG